MPSMRGGRLIAAMGKPSGWTGRLGCALAGCLLPLALAPFNLWLLSLASCAALFTLTRRCRPAEAGLRGWAFGTGAYLIGFSWVFISITRYGGSPPVIGALLTALLCVLLGLFYALLSWMQQRFFAAQAMLAFPALWVLSEWLRTWLMTGMPWLFAGYAHLNTPLAGYAPLLGVLGLSWLCAVSAVALCSKNRWFWVGAAGLWLCGAALKQIEWTQEDGKTPLRMALVQANIPLKEKWSKEQQLEILRIYKELSIDLKDRELLAWPEGALPITHRLSDLRPIGTSAAERQSFADFLHTLRAREQALISGTPLVERNSEGELRFYNSLAIFGAGEGVYRKRRLVPFGEYLPLEDWLGPILDWFNFPMSSYSRAPDEGGPHLLSAAGRLISPSICYEITYPDLIANNLGKASILLTVSDDGWFGNSIAAHQHLQMAQMRALELGRPLARATNSGITAFIDAKGAVRSRLPQFKRAALTAEVSGHKGFTPFARWKGKPVIAGALILLAALMTWRRAKLAVKSYNSDQV